MHDWQKLIGATIEDYAQVIVMPPSMYKKFMAMHTLEAIAKAEAARKVEQARLAAIEAAKSPAQKLREKQAACDHEFYEKHIYRQKCAICKKLYSGAAIKAYQEGHDKGYDAGRDSVESE